MSAKSNAARAAVALSVVPDIELSGEGFATIAEATAYLRCGRTRLYELFEAGLPYRQDGSRRSIPWRALREFAAAGLVRRDRAVAS